MRRLVSEAEAVRLLELGEVVLAATESSFGVLANAADPRALDRLFALKHRQLKGVGLILPNYSAWNLWVEGVPSEVGRLAQRLWPSALTWVLPAKAGVDPRLTEGGSIGARLAGESVAARLSTRSGLSLTATSANPPGLKAAETPEEASRYFPESWVVYGAAPGGAPSTWLGWRNERVELLRAGRVAWPI